MRPRPVRVSQVPAAETGADAGCWREAARLRREHRAWVVIWLARENCYKAYKRMPGARRDTALSGASAQDMAAQIRRAEQAAARPGRQTPGRA
jgi:predicted ATPase